MIEHVVLFKFKTGTPDSTIAEISSELTDLKSRIPEIKYLTFGENFSNRNKGFNYGLVSRFDTRSDLEIYQKHSDHVRVVNENIKPVLDDIVAVDFETP